MKKFLLFLSSALSVLLLSNTASAATTTLTYSTPNVYTVGVAVTLTPAYSNGVPISVTVSTGTLPVGLSISATGVITGTPTTVAGAVNLKVKATNASGTTTSATFTIQIVAAATLSYTSPAAYSVGVAITPLSPTTSTGIAASGFGTGVPLTGATLNEPYGMAIDPSGNIYVTNYNNNTISKYNSAGVYQGLFGTGNPAYSRPAGIVFDAAGNAYVLNRATTGNGTVYKFNSSGVYQSTIVTGLSQAYGIAVDASGNIYVADANAGVIYKYANTGGTALLTVTTNLNYPVGVAVDASGNIYALDEGNEQVYKYTAAGVYTSTLFNVNDAYGIALDSYGDIFVGDTGAGRVREYTSAGATITTINGLTDPEGLVTDTKGNLYVSDFTNNTVTKYPPAAGYYITSVTGGSTTLPAGLSFSSTTGTLSGTPTAAFTATVVTVTAYNAAGTAVTATFTISCTLPAPILAYTGTPFSYTTGVSNTTDVITNTGGAVSGSYTLTITTGALPAGITFNTTNGTFTVIPTAAGSFTGNVTASNTGGTGSAPISMTVTNPAAPSITYSAPAPSYVFTQNVALTGATDPTPTNTGGALPANGYSYTGTLPTGLVFSTATGIISGTPTVVAAATSITVTATNAGGSNSATFTIAIITPSPTISYTGSPFTYSVGTAITSLTPTVTGGPTSYTISPNLTTNTGLTFNTSTGVISGTPTTASAATTYTISAYNTNPTPGTTTISVTTAAPPILAYTTPNNYIVGTAIATLSPTNTGGAVAATAYGTGVSLNTTGLSTPYGMTFDASGNLYVVNNASGTVYKYTGGTGTPASFITGVANATGIVVDAAGNFYVSTSNGYVYKYNSAGGAKTTLVTGGGGTNTSPTSIYGLAIDASGNLYMADENGGNIYKYTASTATTSIIIAYTNGAIINYPYGVGVDASGNIYMMDRTNNLVAKYNSAGTYQSTLVTGLNAPYGFYVDGSGNMYVGDPANGKVYVYTTAGALVATITGPANARGVVTDAKGDIFESNYTSNTITEYPKTGGYTLQYGSGTTSLPPGLAFNSTTGAITGTPTAAFTGTYTVLGYNAAGSGTSNTFTINCVAPPTIAYTGSPYTYYVGVAITNLTPTVTGSPTSYAISPNLNTNTGLTFNTTTGVISGTPTTLSAATTYTVTATNSAGNGTTTISITISGPPTIAYTGSPYTYTVGTAITTLTPTVTGAPTSYTVIPGLPAGLTLNTTNGQISGTPTGTSPTTSYTITANNPAGNGSTTIIITCIPASPTITYNGTPYYFSVGTAITALTPTVTGSPSSYTITPALPAGLTFNTTTGVITGTPTATSAATTYTIKAYNANPTAGSTTITITCGNKPVLAYASPVALTQGTTMASLTPTNTGGAVSAIGTFTASTILTSTYLNEPEYMAVDGSGNLYVASYNNSTIVEYSTTGAVTTVTLASKPSGIAFDAGGNAYVTLANNTVTEFVGGLSGTQTTNFITGLNTPGALAVDASGNIWIANVGTGTVLKFPSTGGATPSVTISPVGVTGLVINGGLALDSSGNVYVTGDETTFFPRFDGFDEYNSAGTYVISGTGFSNLDGIAIDPSGIMYLADRGTGRVYVYTANFTTLLVTETGFTTPVGVAATANGDFYVGDYSANTVTKYANAGGYTESGTLPRGLAFNTSTGAFTGAPQVTGSYTVSVTGHNSYGGGTTSVTFNCAANPPVISYTPSTNVYAIGAAITPLAPAVSGGPIIGAGYTTPGTALAGVTFNNPYGVSVDANGNIWIANYSARNVFKYTAPTTYSATHATTPYYPVGIVADAAGNYYVAYSNGYVYKNGALLTNTINTNGGTAAGIAIDAAGNLYVADPTSGFLWKYTASTATMAPVVYAGTGGLATPYGVAVDSWGNIYAADQTTKSLLEFSSTGSFEGTVVSSLTTPYAVSIDSHGDYWIADAGAKAVLEYDDAGTLIAGVNSGLTSPRGVAVDASGDIYISDYTANTVTEYKPFEYVLTGGALPGGLSFNTLTGTFTGTPTAAFPATTYTISVYGSYGNASTTVTISCAYQPVFTYTSPQIYTDGTAIATLSPNITAGGPITSASILPALPPGLSMDAAGNITGTPTTVNGPITYTVTGTNAAGLSGTATITITCNPALPVISYTTPDVYPDGTAITPLTPTNTGGAVATWSISPGLPTGLTFNTATGVITGTPTVVSPATNYVVTATNATGPATFTINITCNPAIPVISYTTPDVYFEYTAITPLTPTNTGGAVATWSISPGLPAGLTFDTTTGIISGTPTVVSPPTNYLVTATNATGSGTFTININCKIAAPVIAYTTPDVYTDGIAITPLNPNNTGGTATWAISTTLPAGLTFDTTTGIISGTPTVVSPATNYLVTAINATATITQTINITCNPALPVISYTTPDVYTDGTAITPLTPTNTGGAVASWAISPGLPAGLTFDTTTGIISGTPTAVSPATNYLVTATNATGSATFTINITCNPALPVISYTTPDVYPDATAITPLTPTNTGGPVATWSISPGLPTGLNFDTTTGIISGTPTVLSPATNYVVTATNANGSATFTINITCGPALPVITYTTPDVYNVGTAITPLTPTSTGGPIVSWSISPALPAGLSFDVTTGIISGTPTALSAATNYVVTATNASGNGTFTITISCVTSAPIIAYTTPDTYTVGSAIAPLVPTNTGSAAVTWSISPSLPAGLIFNTSTGTITGTPTVVSAATNYLVTATNGGGSGTFTINIACISSGPVLTYTTPDVFPVGTAITPLSPVNTGSTPVSYAISPGLPAGLSFDTTTGIISGTPTATSPATNYLVTATDAGSNTGTFTISIACSNGNDWIGVTSNDWEDATNWSLGTVPGPTDVANIGVNVTFNHYPTVLTGEGTVNVGSVVMGTNGGQAVFLAANSGATLAVAGTITYQSDSNAGLGYTATLEGTGTITAGGISVTANTPLGTPAAYTETLVTTVSSLALSSNVALTSTVDGSGNALNATFNITGGVTSVGGVIQTSNAAGTTSTLSVSGATLQLAGATALSGLSGTGTNVISFNNPGATIEYSGAAQTYYTDAAITGLASGSITYNSIKFSGTGVKSPNGTNANNLLISGDFTNALTTNDAGDYIDLSLPLVNFDGTSQNIYAGNGTGTTFYNVTISTTGTTTIQSGSAAVASTGILTMSGTSAILAAGTNLLTLNSDINGTATVPAIPAGCSITGTVNAQRFITGGALNYRGYRLASSPVYGSNDGTGNIYSINYLINSVYLKGTTGTAGGFDAAGNPNVFLFRENLAGTNATFTSGNFRGVNTLGFAPNYSYLIDVDGGPYNVPAGAGYMFFFRGDRSQASLTTESNTTYIPTNTTLTATGTLNQGQVIARDWYTPTSTNLGYTTISGMASVEGFNLVGNPYPSSIDWDQYQTTTSTSGIYAPNVNPFLYIIDPVNNNYNVYQANSGIPGTQGVPNSNVIPSGQGFFVTAANASAQLIFNESAKTNAQANAANGNLLMARRVASVVPPTSQYMQLRLVKDSINTDGIIIRFNSTASAAFNPAEDARYKNGNGSVSLSSISADNISLAFNSTPLPASANTQMVIPLSVSATTDGTYQIQMQSIKSIPALFTIFLKDAYMKDSLDVRANTTYTFDLLHSDTNTYGAHRFSLVMGENPALMIHLLSFGASKIQTGDQVVWTTENEQNYTNFTVQRSTDNGNTFNDLGGFPSSGQGSYSYLDKTPVIGANSYRLKIVDINGTVSYSNVVTIMYANTGNQIAINGLMVYPNPTAGTVHLSIPTNQGTTTKPAYNIEIVNNLGSVIKSAQSSSPLWQSDVTSLTPGTYFIRVIDTSNNTVVGKSAFVKL